MAELPHISNRKTTMLRKLNRKKYRRQEGLFLIEGQRAVEQVIDNGLVKVRELYFDEDIDLVQEERWQKHAEQNGASLVPADLFLELADTDNPQGVLAACEMPAETSAAELADGEGLIVALDRIQDPGNLGTIYRSAAWFGVDGILLGKGTVDLFHPKVTRSTAGATGSVAYCSGELEELLSGLERKGWTSYLLDSGEESAPLKSVVSHRKNILVVGNEANGIGAGLVKPGRKRLEIPSGTPVPGVESLNASMALSIALYALTAGSTP